MVNITITGLPKNVKIPKLMAYLENVVLKEPVRAKLVNTVIVNGTFKTIVLSMRSNDARKARRLIDGLDYVYAGNVYPLQCWTEDGDKRRSREIEMDYHNVAPPEENFGHYSEPSERPSTIKREIETINLKIELVKKQRILVEEENRMLLEQKKSEMLKSIGPNDYEKLAKFEKVVGRNIPIEQVQKQVANVPHPSTSNAKKKINTKLPSFNAPCKIILSEMKQVLADHVKPEHSDLIMQLIYSTIRKRFIIVLENKDYLPTQDIVHLYRLRYPHNTDKKLLEELANTISQSCWPEKNQGHTKNDNEDSQIKTKNEDADIVYVPDNATQDAAEKLKENDVQIVENNEVHIIEDNDVQMVEENKDEKVDENNVQKVEDNNDQKVEENKGQIDEENKGQIDAENKGQTDAENKGQIGQVEENNDQKVEENTNKESEKNGNVEDVSPKEKALENLDSADQFVDMDNDFDDWVENDATDEKKEDKNEGVEEEI